MQTPVLLLVPPVINALVTGIFTGMVMRQYLARRRIYQLYWSIALGMAFVATLAYIVMLIVQPTSAGGILFFRVYYILGGALMPAWLGMGSIALLNRPLLTRICFSILAFLSLVGMAFTLDARIDLQKLSQIAGTPGTGILAPGPWLVTTIILNTLGVVAVGGIAVYSGWRMLRRQASTGGMHTGSLLWSNVLILAGALLNAIAGTLARLLGIQSTFWLIMALGWSVLFAGVVLASRPRASIAPAARPATGTAHPTKV
ncbi:MAG: hypothetical protein IMW89_08455 [Ktedonobacteraceae bacterium]|nr:hypothetical protein [Ktedonobacteraceae bacterium]